MTGNQRVPTDLAISNFSADVRTLDVTVRHPTTDETPFSATVTVGPVDADEEAEDAPDHFLTLSLAVDGADPGGYLLRVGDDAETVETTVMLDEAGLAPFATASLLVEPDGSLSLASSMR